MDRAHWLLTWTVYGTRLPGDARGFVSGTRGSDGVRRLRNVPRTSFDADIPALRAWSRDRLSEPIHYLDGHRARIVTAEFLNTSNQRGWSLLASAAMPDHVHVVVGLPPPGDSDVAADALRRLKSYSSRELSRAFGRREHWWTRSGSRRLLVGEPAVAAAIRYVSEQRGWIERYVETRWAELLGLDR